MAEEQRRRNASRRQHVDTRPPGLPPRMVSNAGGVDLGESSASIAGACRRHGLVPKPWVQPSGRGRSSRRPRVFDVMLLEGPELEVLEVRLHELSATVDRFILIEGRRTVHGERKPTFFAEHRDTPRFANYRQQLLHYEIPELAYTQNGRSVRQSEIDRLHRTEMRAALRLAGVQPGDVVLAGNADEIPSASTLGLFVACEGWPSNATTVGLLLEPFVFSFELAVHSEPVGSSLGALARVSTYTEEHQSAAFSRNSIGRAESGGAGPVIISDAGWKCTCCFPALTDYIAHCQDRMTNFRFGTDANRRDAQLVQRVLCGGRAEGAVTRSSAQNLRAGGPGMSGTDRTWSGPSVMQNSGPPLHRRHGTGDVPVWLGEQVAVSKGDTSKAPAALFLAPGNCERAVTVRQQQQQQQPPPPPPPPLLRAPSGAVVAAPPHATANPALPVDQPSQKQVGGDPAVAAKHTALPTVGDSAAALGGKIPVQNPTVADAQLGPSMPPETVAASTTPAVLDQPDVAPPAPTKTVSSAAEEPAGHAPGDSSAAAQEARKQRVKKGHGRDR